MSMPDAGEFGDDRKGIHLLPEQVARVEVRDEAVRQLRKPRERLGVVDACSGVELDAELQVWMLRMDELCERRPVGNDLVVPLTHVHTREVRQPAAAVEMGGPVAAHTART